MGEIENEFLTDTFKNFISIKYDLHLSEFNAQANRVQSLGFIKIYFKIKRICVANLLLLSNKLGNKVNYIFMFKQYIEIFQEMVISIISG